MKTIKIGIIAILLEIVFSASTMAGDNYSSVAFQYSEFGGFGLIGDWRASSNKWRSTIFSGHMIEYDGKNPTKSGFVTNNSLVGFGFGQGLVLGNHITLYAGVEGSQGSIEFSDSDTGKNYYFFREMYGINFRFGKLTLNAHKGIVGAMLGIGHSY